MAGVVKKLLEAASSTFLLGMTEVSISGLAEMTAGEVIIIDQTLNVCQKPQE